MQVKRIISIVIFYCFLTSNIFAQTNQYFIPTVFNKSPNSAEFAKYGTYPVNLYSGLPDITIPLFTAKSGDLEVPVTLSYHASGIKVEQVATWVGLGWSLNAGGSITREVIGTPDEQNGYFHSFNDGTSLNVYDETDLTMLWSTVTQHGHDNRPDMFSYDIPGHSGKFFFNARDGYKTEYIPFTPIRITNTAVNIAVDTPRFTVLDEHGNKFLLGDNYREVTSTGNIEGTSSIAPTAWMLESMVSQNTRDTIKFSYQSQTLILPEQTGEVRIVEDYEQEFKPGLIGSYPKPYINNSTTALPSNTYTGVNEQEIKEIVYKNEKAVFILSATKRNDLNGIIYPLDRIDIYAYDFSTRNYDPKPLKSIVFHKSYYSTLGTQPRMRLDSIQILDKAGSIAQHYRFTYDSQPLPAYGSFSRDFWGYYNGKMDDPATTPKTLIPRMQIDFQPDPTFPASKIWIGSSDATSRDPDSTLMQAGVLKRIDYPTGGHTDFTYQTNRYLDDSSNVRLAGGLRVSAIASYDSPTSVTPILKTYQYNVARPNWVTSGANGFINYGFFMNEVNSRYFTTFVPTRAIQKNVRSFYSESSSGLTPSEGNPIAYLDVAEYIGTPTTNIGKTVYQFRYAQDYYVGSTPATGVPVIEDHSFERGQLLYKANYLRKSNGTYQIVDDVSNTYFAFPDTSYVDVGLVVGQRKRTEGNITIALPNIALGDDDAYSYPYAAYSILSGDNYLTSTTTKKYDMSNPLKFSKDSVAYKYDNRLHQQVSRTYQTDSKGNTYIQVNKYPADYLVGTTTTNTVLDNMLSRNMQAALVETYDSIRYTSPVSAGIIAGQLNRYTFGVSAIVPESISKLKAAAPSTSFTPSHIASTNLVADNAYQTMINFDRYDYYNNLTQYTPKNATPTYIIWDYDHSLPIAEVKNVLFNGATYDNNSAFTSFEAKGMGNWQFSGTPIPDVTAPTGTMVYSLSGNPVYFYNANLAKSHLLTYWSNAGAATVTLASSVPGIALRSANGWTYYQHVIPITAGSPTITITGNVRIDELRLYPADAQMTTYAYDANGITSITDSKGQSGRFEYDFAQRLKNIKDWNGNIVKNTDYHNYDMTVGNDAKTATFTKNDCPPYTNPTSTTFTVAANKYRSSTKASANNMATYDRDVNGQIYANVTCGCPQRMINFTLRNYTGVTGFNASFSGPTHTYFPFSSSSTPTVVQVPAGIYTISVNAINAPTQRTFTLGGRTPVHSPGVTFTSVLVDTGSAEVTLNIQN